jgi:FtsZ-interacting cell division protein YlmF
MRKTTRGLWPSNDLWIQNFWDRVYSEMAEEKCRMENIIKRIREASEAIDPIYPLTYGSDHKDIVREIRNIKAILKDLASLVIEGNQ